MTKKRDQTKTTGKARQAAPQAAPDTPVPDPARAGIDAVARRRLGLNLRLFYAGVLNEPLPERFTQLLTELSRNSSRKEGA